jgi:hypothetical protein
MRRENMHGYTLKKILRQREIEDNRRKLTHAADNRYKQT